MFDDVLRPATPVMGNFTHSGLPANFKLGDTRVVLQSHFAGSSRCLAPVYGAIEIPVQFLFSGASTVVNVNAVVGNPDAAGPSDWAIRFGTARTGSVGGIVTLEVNARVEKFEYYDRTENGGFGAKTIAIDGVAGKVRVIMTGNANKANFRLSVNGEKAAIAMETGHQLAVTMACVDGWFEFTVTDA